MDFKVNVGPVHHKEMSEKDMPVNIKGIGDIVAQCADCGEFEMMCACVKKPDTKDTNPKDAVGIKKPPASTVSGPVIAQLGLAMLEGARKYGRHNYRVSGVRASVYYDAAWRHMTKWWEGEDIDKDSGLDHVIKAIASLVVLYDAMIFDNWIDDRPPPLPNPEEFWESLNKKALDIIKRYPNAVPAFTHEDAKKVKSDEA